MDLQGLVSFSFLSSPIWSRWIIYMNNNNIYYIDLYVYSWTTGACRKKNKMKDASIVQQKCITIPIFKILWCLASLYDGRLFTSPPSLAAIHTFAFHFGRTTYLMSQVFSSIPWVSLYNVRLDLQLDLLVALAPLENVTNGSGWGLWGKRVSGLLFMPCYQCDLDMDNSH